jgi:hypothetical protein
MSRTEGEKLRNVSQGSNRDSNLDDPHYTLITGVCATLKLWVRYTVPPRLVMVRCMCTAFECTGQAHRLVPPYISIICPTQAVKLKRVSRRCACFFFLQFRTQNKIRKKQKENSRFLPYDPSGTRTQLRISKHTIDIPSVRCPTAMDPIYRILCSCLP